MHEDQGLGLLGCPTGLIDQYQLIVCPLVLGSGKALFNGKPGQSDLKLLESRSFDLGTVLLSYAPK